MFLFVIGSVRGIEVYGGMAKISSIGSQQLRLKTKQTATSGQHNLMTWLISSLWTNLNQRSSNEFLDMILLLKGALLPHQRFNWRGGLK